MSVRISDLPQNDPRNIALREKLREAPVVMDGWPWQCYCGTTKVVKYRGYRCGRCGRRWWTFPDHPASAEND